MTNTLTFLPGLEGVIATETSISLLDTELGSDYYQRIRFNRAFKNKRVS